MAPRGRGAAIALLALAASVGRASADACNPWASACTETLGVSATLPGVPGDGLSIGQGSKMYFKFPNADDNSDVTVAMSVYFGDPDLYVEIGDVEPTLLSTYRSQTSNERDVVTIRSSALKAANCPGGKCTISVMVRGFTTSLFRLMASSGATIVQLLDGEPQRDFVEKEHYAYFVYDVKAPSAAGDTTKPLTITVTPLSGDPDLLIKSCTVGAGTANPCPDAGLYPTKADYDFQAQSWGGDTITIDESHHTGDTKYYIGVYAWFNASTFTIVAQQDKQTVLADGQPQEGQVLAHGARYYHLNVVGDITKSVYISVTPQSGDVDLYVTSNKASDPVVEPTRTTYSWAATSNWYTPDTLHLHPTDAGFLRERGQYNIMVYGTTPANFSIVAATEGAVVTLRDGIPQQAAADANHFAYFQFHVDDPNQDIAIDVTPLDGDPDLFVSCSLNATGTLDGTPSSKHNDWHSQNWGVDTVVVNHLDRAPKAVPCQARLAGGLGATYYIAVYGYRDSTFNVLGSMDDGRPTTLIDGQPQSGSVIHLTYKRYEIYLGSSDGGQDLAITVTPVYGDPDLYINTQGRQASMTPGDYQFKSQFTDGKDYVYIEAKDLCVNCYISIAVYGYKTSAYTITATTSAAIRTLQDGIAVRDFVSHMNYDYYVFDVTQPGTTLEVTVTTIQGDPDLFVSRMWKRPSYEQYAAHNHTLGSLGIGDDIISVTNADVGRWYISVRGWLNTSFTVIAHARIGDGEAMQRLVLGQPQQGRVENEEWAYFQLIIGDEMPGSITFVGTPLNGQIGVYINKCEHAVDMCDGGRPGSFDARPKTGTPAMWSSDTSLSRESIRIPQDDPLACKQCSYIVGVFGHGAAGSSYTLTATIAGDMVLLQDGVPFRDYVKQYEYEYFTFQLLEKHEDVIISITPFTGDPDVFVTACGLTFPSHTITENCVDHPTNTSYQWQHRSFGADTLAINYESAGSCIPTSTQTCDYYVAVYGYKASSFSIMFSSHSDIPITLVDGIPQQGAVNASMTQQYQIYIEPGHEELEITLTPRVGDADLYVTTDGTKPDPTTRHYDYRSISSSGDDHIHISSSDTAHYHCLPAATCLIRIAVVGFRSSQYSIVAASQAAITSLQSGQPLRDTVQGGKFEYFQLSADVPNSVVSIILTPVSGDPDIYVSSGAAGGTTKPTSAAYFWRASRLGTDVIEIFPDDPHACGVPCNYYIGVTGYQGDASFIITARQATANPTSLIDGIPQQGAVNRSMTDQYMIVVPSNDVELEITLTPRVGDADLFVTTDGRTPKPGDSDYQSLHMTGDDSVTFKPIADSHCGANGVALCMVRIAVKGFSDSVYTIVARTNGKSVILQDGVPLRDSVGEGQWDVYQYRNEDVNNAVSIVLTPIAGDPDMYVSTSPDVGTDPSKHFWYANRIGQDVIDIFPDDPHHCTPAPCNYYIGVTGWRSNATFTIMAANHSGLPITLVDGEPQMGRIDAGRVNRYQFDIPGGAHSVDFAMSPIYGDPDMYATVDGTAPSRTNANYRSLSTRGEDVISVNRSDTRDPAHQFCPIIGVSCRVQLAVYGFQASEYTITAGTTDGLTRLAEGVATRSTVGPMSYTYFTFTVTRPNSAVTFTMTPFSGDPDMYISHTENRPTDLESKHSWHSTSLNQDIVRIEADDPKGCKALAPCTYYIGIKGFLVSSSFSLTASVDHDAAIDSLSGGYPQRGHVDAYGTAYYQFRASTTNYDVEFITTRFSGEVDMYVITNSNLGGAAVVKPHWNCPPGTTTPTPTACSMTDYTWTSTSSFSRNRVYVHNTDANFCGGATCYYIVAVVGTSSAGSDFSITGVTSDNIVTLQDGVPQEGAVEKGRYEYYRVLTSTPGSDLLLSMTNFMGDPDMYVDENITRPTRDINMHTWRSYSFNNDALSIQWGQMSKCAETVGRGGQCEIYIGVYGYTNASYSILASLDQSITRPVLLVDGTPQQSFVNRTRYAYFMAHVVLPAGTPMSVSVTPTYGDPDLYVLMDPMDPANPLPNDQPGDSNYHYASTHYGGEDRVQINPGDEHYCSHCVMRIAVKGFKSSAFTITYVSGDTVQRLRDGSPAQGVVQRDSYNYYSFGVEAPDADVTITVTPISGDPDIFVSKEHSDNPLDIRYRPTVNSYTWAGIRYGDDVVRIRHTDPNFCYGCNYLIGVYGAHNASYSITATAEAKRIISLVDGQPQLNAVDQGEYKYYKMRVIGTAARVTFRVVTRTGTAVMYVTNRYLDNDPPVGQLPTSNQYLWSSLSATTGSRNTVTIPSSDPYWDQAHMTFTIGVKGTVSSVFTISATTDEAIQTLQAGVPSSTALVASGMTQHYVFNMDRTDSDIYFRLSPLSGDPDLLVSARNPRYPPTCKFLNPEGGGAHVCYNYTWISQNGGGDDMLNISHTEPCLNAPSWTHCQASIDWVRGRFYVGVFGYKESNYVITAGFVGDHISLTDGQYQVSVTSPVTLCKDRDMATGACVDGSTLVHRQGAFFQFVTGGGSSTGYTDSDIAVEVTPMCGGDGGRSLQSGDCRASIEFYVIACGALSCLEVDRYPWASRMTFAQALPTSTTIFIPREHPSFCSGTDQVCNYYVGVYKRCPAGVSAEECGSQQFKVKYTSGHGVDLIPHDCLAGKLCPQQTALLDAGQTKDYEIYVGDTKTDLTVRLDACKGAPSFYMCHDKCAQPFYPSPQPNNHQWVGHTKDVGSVTTIVEDVDATFYVAVVGEDDTAASQWSYKLIVSSGDVGVLAADLEPTFAGVTDHQATITWQAPKLHKKASEEPAPDGLTYTIYTAPGGFPADVVKNTACGLEAYAASNAANVVAVPAGAMSFTLASLLSETTYEIAVVAKCGDGCAEEGQSQATAFPVIKVTTAATKIGGGTVVAIILVCIAIPAVAVVCYLYRRNKRRERQLQYDMTETDDFAAVVSQPVVGYRPLSLDDDDAPRPLSERIAMHMGS